MKKKYQNKDWLYNQYVTNKKSAYKIAKDSNCGKTTIYELLKKFDVPIRTKSEVKIINHKKYMNKKWLHDQYINQKKSIPKIPKICNCGTTTIWRWLKKFNIQRRTLSEVKKGNKYAWIGNIVKYNGLHMWINNHKEKTGICTICNEYKKTEWSNIDHKYERNLDNYWELCRSCHKLYDKLRSGERVK